MSGGNSYSRTRGDGVELMLPQGDLRVDAAEHDMPSIILAGPDGVEQLIVLLALESAQPKDLTASEIDLRLGATWLDKRYVQQFMYELFKTPPVQKGKIHVNFSEYTGEWNITGKNTVTGYDVAANTTYGTDRLNAYHLHGPAACFRRTAHGRWR